MFNGASARYSRKTHPPGSQVGRLRKFKLSEIDEWVHAGRAGQDEPAPGKENG